MKYKIRKDLKLELYNKTLYRIEALKDFFNVTKGDLGGYVESESNLSQEGDCWIYGDALVFDDTQVCHNTRVLDDAQVLGDAIVNNSMKISSKQDLIVTIRNGIKLLKSYK